MEFIERIRRDMNGFMKELSLFEAHGQDGVWLCVLEECVEPLDWPLEVCRDSLDEKAIPLEWKRANGVPIMKGVKKSKRCANY